MFSELDISLLCACKVSELPIELKTAKPVDYCVHLSSGYDVVGDGGGEKSLGGSQDFQHWFGRGQEALASHLIWKQEA